MAATGLDVFDRTLQITNIWLNDIQESLGPDEQRAWRVLGAVLHGLRDRFPSDLSAHLGAQLPLLIRGLYYDQYRPSAPATRWRSMDEFAAAIDERLSGARPTDRADAVRAVFRVLKKHVDRGQIEKLQDALPGPIRDAWIEA